MPILPIPAAANPQRSYGDVYAGMSAYEVDLWGKIRRSYESANARIQVSEDDARQIVLQSASTLSNGIQQIYSGLSQLRPWWRTRK